MGVFYKKGRYIEYRPFSEAVQKYGKPLNSLVFSYGCLTYITDDNYEMRKHTYHHMIQTREKKPYSEFFSLHNLKFGYTRFMQCRSFQAESEPSFKMIAYISPSKYVNMHITFYFSMSEY